MNEELSLADVLEAIKKQHAVPADKILWSCDDIGKHMGLMARTISECYVPRPDFPAPVLTGRARRWYMIEILEWIESTRPRRRKAQ